MRVRLIAAAAAALLAVVAASVALPATAQQAAVRAEPRAAADEPDRPLRWLALGDSYSSGEGVNENYGDCARAPGAYASKARNDLSSEGYPVGEQDFLACTGATIENEPDSESIDLVEQIEKATGRYDLITLTIGGNDVGFGDTLRTCLDPRGPSTCAVQEADLAADIDALRPDLVRIYGRLVDELLTPGGHVVVLGYPRIFEASDSWPRWIVGLGHCELLAAYESDMIRRLGARLSSTIRSAAGEHPGRVHYLDVAGMFEGHNLCTGWGTTDEWINGVSLGIEDTNRFPWRPLHSFHPNRTGHAAQARLLADYIKDLDWSRIGADKVTETITLWKGGLTISAGSTRTQAEILGRPPVTRARPVVEAITDVMGRPFFDGTGIDLPSACRDKADRWVAWGDSQGPALTALFTGRPGRDTLVGFWTYADSPRVKLADGVPVGSTVESLRKATPQHSPNVTGPRAVGDGVEFELKGLRGMPPLRAFGPEIGELSGTSQSDRVLERGSGVQCGTTWQ